jgi:hypothetical protein
LLTCDKALAAMLEAIAYYKKGNKPSSPMAAASIPKPTVRTVDKDIEESNEDIIILDPPPTKETPPAATATHDPASKKTAKDKTVPTAPSKKKAATPSTYIHCSQLLKFLIATFQQHHYKKLEDKILNRTLVCPTLDLEHCQWAAIKQVQAEVNQTKKDSITRPRKTPIRQT